MILVDRRVGSKELLTPLQASGYDAEITELEYADIAFVGRGPNGSSLDIGVELKNLNDLVQSLRSGRLAGHQLPGLRATYEHAWLVVEGQWRTNDAGMVITYQGKQRGWVPLHGKMTASELEKQVLTLELCGGLHVRYTNSRRDSVRFMGTLYRWFTDVAADQHTSHLALHQQPTLVPISDFRQTVCRFPGVGLKASLAVEVTFESSLRDAVNADMHAWANIVVGERRLGEKTAQRIVNFCEGR